MFAVWPDRCANYHRARNTDSEQVDINSAAHFWRCWIANVVNLPSRTSKFPCGTACSFKRNDGIIANEGNCIPAPTARSLRRANKLLNFAEVRRHLWRLSRRYRVTFHATYSTNRFPIVNLSVYLSIPRSAGPAIGVLT